MMEAPTQLLVPVTYLVTVTVSLSSAIVALFWLIQKQNTKNSSETKSLLEAWRTESMSNVEKMTKVVSDNNSAMQMLTRSVESNTRSTEKIFEHLKK